MIFLAPRDWNGWSRCPGKPALEEYEPDPTPVSDHALEAAAELLRRWGMDPKEPPPEAYDSLKDLPEREGITRYVEAVRGHVASHKLSGARVSLLIDTRLDLSQITGEKGAEDTCHLLLLAQFESTSTLEAWELDLTKDSRDATGTLELYALAGVLTHGLFHTFTEVNLVFHQPLVKPEPEVTHIAIDQLHAFGAVATEKAALSLTLRGDVAALTHLVPGEPCTPCRAKYRCPELEKVVSREVFGPLQKADDPRAVPVQVADKALQLPLHAKAELFERALKRVPLIEAWCKNVREAAAEFDDEIA